MTAPAPTDHDRPLTREERLENTLIDAARSLAFGRKTLNPNAATWRLMRELERDIKQELSQ